MFLLRKSARKLQGRTEVHGIPVSVENRPGSIRQWKNPDNGTEGMTRMRLPYGYFTNGPNAVDGDKLDCFVGPHREEATHVFVIHQLKGPDFIEYDEPKCMCGFLNGKDALDEYFRHYDDPRFFGGMDTIEAEGFKAWLDVSQNKGEKYIDFTKSQAAHAATTRTNRATGKVVPVKAFTERHVDAKPKPQLILLKNSRLDKPVTDAKVGEIATRRSASGKLEIIPQKGVVKRKTPNATVILKPANTGRQQIGITGQTEEQLRQIATERGFKVPPAWTDIWVNADASAGLQVKGRDEGGTLQRLYSKKHTGAAAVEKFERLKSFAKAYPAIMKHVNADFDTSTEARVLYLISRSAFRLGGEKERGAVKAYGASNLLREHTEVKGSRISFSFTGKKGIDNEHIVTDKRLADYVAKVKKGRLFKTDENAVRSYLTKLGYDGFLVKDFRTHIANETAIVTMSKMTAPATPQEYQKSVKIVCEAVAAKLGNGWTMARDSYIAPEVFSKWTL